MTKKPASKKKTKTKPTPPANENLPTQVSPAGALRSAITSMSDQFLMALPAHIKPERFVRVAMSAVTGNPKLVEADRTSFFAACMRSAQDGLLPDGNEAALVPFWDKQDNCYKVVYMAMIAGILKKVRNSGDLKTIGAHVVYDGDEFDYELGDNERIFHRPNLDRDKDAKRLYTYAVAHTKDGGIYREIMTEAQIQAVRNVSKAKDSGPWSGDFADEMRRKTALRRLAKRLPLSTDILEAIMPADDFGFDRPADEPEEGRVQTGPATGLRAALELENGGATVEGEAEVVAHPESPADERNPPGPTEEPEV